MKNQTNHFGDQRQIIDTNTAEYDIYDFGGPVLEGVHQLDLSYDRKTGHGVYMIRMEPGTVTTTHVHSLREEYLILEGDVVESDGTVLGPGDYVIYQPGTEHNSRTVNGCVVIGFEYPAPV
jgi:anti-sigma factor ChrR (cupin superfamily)